MKGTVHPDHLNPQTGNDLVPVDLSLVLACYNDGPYLVECVREIVTVLADASFSFEIIFVEDCSTDDTRQQIARAVDNHPEHTLRAIYHDVNVGRGGTVTDGFRAATGTVAGFIDIDLEVHARYIPSMVRAVFDGADMAVARRIYTFRPSSIDRYILSKGYSWLIRKTSVHCSVVVSLRSASTLFLSWSVTRCASNSRMARRPPLGRSTATLMRRVVTASKTVREMCSSWFHVVLGFATSHHSSPSQCCILILSGG